MPVKIDKAGRLKIPEALLEKLNWHEGKEVHVFQKDDVGILIVTAKPSCTLCYNASDKLTKFKFGLICPACFADLYNNVKQY